MKKSEESQDERPEGLYSDGTYLCADYNNRIVIINLSDLKILKIITNSDDVKELQIYMKACCVSLALAKSGVITSIIQKYIEKE